MRALFDLERGSEGQTGRSSDYRRWVRRPSPLVSTLLFVAVAFVLALARWWVGRDASDADPSLSPALRSEPSAPSVGSDASNSDPGDAPRTQPPGLQEPTPEAAPSKGGGPAVQPASAAKPDPAELRAAILAKHRPAREEPTSVPAAKSGELRKRVEGHEALFAELQADFMPLADECIEQAQGRDESLEGMLALGLELLVDDELGPIVETIEFPADTNEIDDPELHTCMRESLLSMILPPEAESGRTALMLTLPIEP